MGHPAWDMDGLLSDACTYGEGISNRALQLKYVALSHAISLE